MAQAADNGSFDTLLEPLRKLDALLAIARKRQLESGEVPPGVLEDFHEVRKQIEKTFVFHFGDVDAQVQRSLRNFLLQSRDLTTERFARNLDKLSTNARSMLNALMIQGAPTQSLIDDMADKPAPKPAHSVAQAVPTPRRPRWMLPAAGGIVLVAAVALFGAWVAGVLKPPASSGNEPVTSGPGPANAPPQNTPLVEQPFDARAAGYAGPLAQRPLDAAINPLEAERETLLLDDLMPALLGLEDLVHLLEPGRLKLSPAQTRESIAGFAQDAVRAEPSWREARRPLLDAFVEHARQRLNLALYSDSGAVLPSDVLYSRGAGQQALCATLIALAAACSAPVTLYAPNGVELPVIGVPASGGVDTYNGSAFGRREGLVPTARTPEVLAALCERLRHGLGEPAARAVMLAIIARQAGALDAAQAASALADLDAAWLADPAPEEATPQVIAARLLYPLLGPALAQSLDASQALKLYRLASAAGDAAGAQAALLLLAQRAGQGATIDGQPLALVVGDMLREARSATDAEVWYRRALAEHPDDPRPALRLADLLPAERPAMLRQAYARGERSAPFMLELAASLTRERRPLSALAVLDHLCASSPLPAHIEQAVLACLALERPDWAQQRIQKYADIQQGDALKRLDLICELQRFGLSERARELAAGMPRDEFLDDLLRRHGG